MQQTVIATEYPKTYWGNMVMMVLQGRTCCWRNLRALLGIILGILSVFQNYTLVLIPATDALDAVRRLPTQSHAVEPQQHASYNQTSSRSAFTVPYRFSSQPSSLQAELPTGKTDLAQDFATAAVTRRVL